MTATPVEHVLDAIRSTGLLDPARPLLAMLSGGRDSVCLLDAAVTLRGLGAIQALHVNYGLRLGADEDESYCRSLCQQLGVQIEVVRAEKPAEPGNLQAWARDLRYEAASRLATPLKALIATGHTATDQVETILYRLAASPGRRALLGMPAVEGDLIRPLLSVTRDQTAAYCEARGLSWREDSTNATDKYARGRVRTALLPALRAIHPAAESNVLKTAELLRDETEVFDGLVAAHLADTRPPNISLPHLATLPKALQRQLVIRLAEQAAGKFVPQAGDRVPEILALANRGGRAELHVGSLVSAVIENDTLSMVAIKPHYPRPPAQ